MAGIQMGGLASGLDTTTLISQLMSIERQPRARLERQAAAAQQRQDHLRDIVTKLKALKTAASDLQGTSLWTAKQTVASADSAKVAARSVGSTPAGTYDVAVTQLATTASRTLTIRTRPQPSDLTITDSAGTALPPIGIPANATVDQIVAAVNADTTRPVVARSLNGQLVLESRTTGSAANFTVAGQVITGESASTTAVNTQFSVNGTAHESQTRTSTAIPGLELSLSQLTVAGTPVRVTIGESAIDKDAVAGKMKAFVDAYNAVVDTIRSRTAEKRVPNAQSLTDAKRGVLFGDSTLGQALSQLRIGVMEPVAVGNTAAIDELHEIGISTGTASAVSAEKNNGRLVFDQVKFTSAWDGDKASVERLLRGAGGLTGYGARMDAIIKPLTDAGGLLDNRITSAGGEVSRLRDSMGRMDDRLERKELFLRRQFTALETALQRMQSQSVEMASSLPKPSSSSS
jgi:flagellar hook-associated protein 2